MVRETERTISVQLAFIRPTKLLHCLEVLQWLKSVGNIDPSKPHTGKLLRGAALCGHLERGSKVVSRLVGFFGSDSSSMTTCAAAAENCHLDVLKWLRSNGCLWDQDTCESAAWNGHLEVLEWARSNGCLWDSWTCGYAAEGGHLEVLEWARAPGMRKLAGVQQRVAIWRFLSGLEALVAHGIFRRAK